MLPWARIMAVRRTSGPVTLTSPVELLRANLAADSPLREASIAKSMAGCGLVAIPFVLMLLNGGNNSKLPLAITAMLASVSIWYLVLLRLIRSGRFRSPFSVANVTLEVSIPALVVWVAAEMRGLEYALMSPMHVLWGTLVVGSSLRARPKLSIYAGGLAASEWLLLYTLVYRPRLEAPVPISLQWPAAILRAVCLLFCGVFALLFARHYVRKAEEALSAVREQDLMGKYFLHERLGAGGMAEVFRATYCPEGGFQKEVAIKRVLPSYSANAQFVEMFREEARLCASLNHPNIVQVLDCGKFRDSFVLAMEYVEGLPLSQVLRRLGRPLPIPAVTYLGFELARALDYIHRRVDSRGRHLHLVHRDVNPPNILLSRIGEVKLADFGVANAATRVETGRSDVFYGKLQYAAPEQLTTGALDGRADLFALGLVLNEALTGKKVFGPESESALKQGIFPRIPCPSELRSDVPPPLDALVMSLCAIDPAVRPATGAAVRQQLLQLEGVAAPFPTGQQALAAAVEQAVARYRKDGNARPPDQVTDGGEVTPSPLPIRRMELPSEPQTDVGSDAGSHPTEGAAVGQGRR